MYTRVYVHMFVKNIPVYGLAQTPQKKEPIGAALLCPDLLCHGAGCWGRKPCFPGAGGNFIPKVSRRGTVKIFCVGISVGIHVGRLLETNGRYGADGLSCKGGLLYRQR